MNTRWTKFSGESSFWFHWSVLITTWNFFCTQICFSVQICKSFQNLHIFKPLSFKEEINFYVRSFIIVFSYVFCLIRVKLWKTIRPLSDALRLSLRKGITILVKLRTTLFNCRPKIFRQRSSNKMRLNMNSSNKIYTDSPRGLTTT